jgi:hypothetical protein
MPHDEILPNNFCLIKVRFGKTYHFKFILASPTHHSTTVSSNEPPTHHNTTVSSNDPSYFGLHKAVFIVVVCLVSLLALMSMVVCGICIRKKHVSIIMLTTHHDDRHEFCPNNGGQDSHLEMKKTTRT